MVTPSLIRLLARGDEVAIEQGRLVLLPASGRQAPSEWLKTHERNLITQAASLAGIAAFEYLSYSVGQYGRSRAGGVTLQFRCINTGQPLFAIFNVDTRRARTTKHGKAGASLPPGQFRVGKRSAFYHFWTSTGLPVRRLSDFHDYMGKLGSLIFTGTASKGERLDAATLQPLDLPASELTALIQTFRPDKLPTPTRQDPDNCPTNLPDKESAEAQQRRRIQTDATTGAGKYGNTVIRKYGDTGNRLTPKDQSVDDWLADYAEGG